MRSQNPLTEVYRNAGFGTQLRNMYFGVFLRYRADIHSFRNTATYAVLDVPEQQQSRMFSPQKSPRNRSAKWGDENLRKQQVSWRFLTLACRFTYLASRNPMNKVFSSETPFGAPRRWPARARRRRLGPRTPSDPSAKLESAHRWGTRWGRTQRHAKRPAIAA